MYFKDIIGQHAVKERLIRMALENRVPHAQLFAGPEGVGKLALALAFVRLLYCKTPQNGEGCGKCSSCVKISKLQHPDLHFSFPVVKPAGGKKAVSDDSLEKWRKMLVDFPYESFERWLSYLDIENKQLMIYTEEADNISHKLGFKSYEAPYKFMVMYLPERMHVGCANKLLKLIEDPPEKTCFILISEDPDAIITTILSRCQAVVVPAIESVDMVQSLQKNYGIEIQRATDIAHIAGGNWLKAREMVELADQNIQNVAILRNLLNASYQRNILEMRKWADGMTTLGRERQKHFLSFFGRLIRESFILNFGVSQLNYLTPEENELAAKIKNFVREHNIESFNNEIDLAIKHIEQNVNGRFVFFDLAVKVIMLLKS